MEQVPKGGESSSSAKTKEEVKDLESASGKNYYQHLIGLKNILIPEEIAGI